MPGRQIKDITIGANFVASQKVIDDGEDQLE
jgi:hypothetical protein